MTDNIEKLHSLLEIQGRHGNWNYSAYMHGMYNGMELALSILEDRNPNFRDKPDKWLFDEEKI